MARRRPPEADYICRRCLCSCDVAGTRHLGGGSRGMHACAGPPLPVLRAWFDAEIAADVAVLRDRHRRQ